MPVWLTAGAVIALLGMMALVFVLILVYALTRPSGGDSARYTIAAAVIALAVLVAVALFVLLMALADARGKPREKEKEGDRIRSIRTAGSSYPVGRTARAVTPPFWLAVAPAGRTLPPIGPPPPDLLPATRLANGPGARAPSDCRWFPRGP
jgi:hypothetical protein